jgi:hypothetical protein
MDPRKSIWEVDNENMEERINARRERIRKRIGRLPAVTLPVYHV